MEVSVLSWTASLVEYYTVHTFDVVIYISTLTRVAIEIFLQDQPSPNASGLSNAVLIGIVCGGAVVMAVFGGFVLYIIRRGRDPRVEFINDDQDSNEFTANVLSTVSSGDDDPDTGADDPEFIRPSRSESGGSEIELPVSDASDEVIYV